MENEQNPHLVLVVLGKRLKGDRLTLEGRSRVAALYQALQTRPELSGASVIFCGGVTSGQRTSEALRMHQAYRDFCQQSEPRFAPGKIYLEDKSTTTVENIRFVSEILVHQIASTFAILSDASRRPALRVMFVSNDYHLQRIFEIQQLMPQQGLLRLMQQYCIEHQVELVLPYQLERHISASYPYSSEPSSLFLLAETLTTYRVYLEGRLQGNVTSGVSTRRRPFDIAQHALAQMNEQAQHDPEVSERIRQLMMWTATDLDDVDPQQLSELVRQYHECLLGLNRKLDPENGAEGR